MLNAKFFAGLMILFFSVISLVVAKPNLVPANVNTPNGPVPVIIPEHAKEIADGVFILGEAQDVDGRVVEGLMFIHYKKENAKPPWAGQGKGGGEKCFSLFAEGARWKQTENYTTGAGINTTVTETSLETWDSNVSFEIFGVKNLTGTTNGADDESPDGNNEVMFEDLGADNTIAFTIVWGIFRGPPSGRELVEWDAVFNNNYTFGNFDGSAEVMDYQNIATHEFGHALGLGHPDDSCTEETMYRFAAFNETKKRTLEAGDSAGVTKLYS